MKKIRNKYYKQIVLALIMVSLCPVIFLGGSIYRLIHEQMDSLYGNLQDSVEKERNHYEVIFQYLDAQLLQLSLDTDFNNIIGREMTAENFRIFTNVQDGVQIVSNLEESLNEVYLINFPKNWLISPVSRESLQEETRRRFDRFINYEENTFISGMRIRCPCAREFRCSLTPTTGFWWRNLIRKGLWTGHRRIPISSVSWF